MTVSRLLRRTGSLAAALVTVGTLTAGTASAQPNPTCTAEFTPAEFTIYLDDLDAVVAEQSTVFAGGWDFVDSPLGWYRIDDGSPVALPTEIVDGAMDVPITAENLVNLLTAAFAYEPTDGDAITLTVWVTVDPDPTFDESNMQCSAVAEITFGDTSPLPDTGADVDQWLWAVLLVSLGAVTVFGAARRLW